MRYSTTKLGSLAVLVPSNGAMARAGAIDISGSVAGTATVGLAGRCTPFRTVSATGTALQRDLVCLAMSRAAVPIGTSRSVREWSI